MSHFCQMRHTDAATRLTWQKRYTLVCRHHSNVSESDNDDNLLTADAQNVRLQINARLMAFQIVQPQQKVQLLTARLSLHKTQTRA